MNCKHYLSFNYHICEAKQITVAGKEGCLVQRTTFKLVTIDILVVYLVCSVVLVQSLCFCLVIGFRE